MATATRVSTLVEGELDEAAAARILERCGYQIDCCYGKRGCAYIKKKIQGFNQAAVDQVILALVDFMDTRLDCPPRVVAEWLPHPSQNMVFRVVVRELESWLLADKHNMAKFLHVAPNKIPANADELDDPKRKLVNLARGSSSRAVKSALVPAPKSTAPVGKLYQSEMVGFIRKIWDIDAARKNSPSLDRCLVRLEDLKRRT